MSKLDITPAGSATAAPSGSAGGDLGGTYPNPTLATATWDVLDYGVAPADCGLKAWTYPAWVGGASASYTLNASQDVWAFRIRNLRSQTITNVVMDQGTAGASFAGNGAKFAIFSSDGATQYFVTADVSASLGSTGWVSVAFATPGTLAAGAYWLAWWFNASTVPKFVGGPSNAVVPRMGSAAASLTTRATTGATDMPATITPSAAGGTAGQYWFGLT